VRAASGSSEDGSVPPGTPRDPGAPGSFPLGVMRGRWVPLLILLKDFLNLKGSLRGHGSKMHPGASMTHSSGIREGARLGAR
jgi:hypothetical protein